MKKKKPVKKPEKPLPLVKIDQLSLAESVEKVLIGGDLSPLSPEQRVDYYKKVCMSLGLNPLTTPFQYILFRESEGSPARLSLYANKSCAEQLRKMHGISVVSHTQKIEDGMCYVEVQVKDRTGRTDVSMGVVPLWKWKDGKRIEYTGKDLANALMKCSTKAKRRATLSISGLAVLDESELDGVQVVGGVTPDGRIYQYRNLPPEEQPQLDDHARHGHAVGTPRALQAEATLKRIEEQDRQLAEAKKASQEASNAVSVVPEAAKPEPLPELPAEAPQVAVDWHDKDNPIVTGDADAIEALKPLLTWGNDGFWRVKAADVPKINEACVAAKYRFLEILPERASTAAPVARESAPREGGGPKPKAQKAAPGAEPEIVKGIIEQVSPKMTKGTPKRPSNPFLSVMIKSEGRSQFYSVFNKDLFEHLNRGKGKEAEVILEKRGDYFNLVGLKRIGGTEFVDNLPVIKKDREAGSQGLFT